MEGRIMSGIIGGISRALLALLGGIWGGSDAEIGKALRTFVEQLAAGDSNALGGSIVTIAAIAWSIYDKRKKQIAKESK
jgi:hypothetical protein